MRRKGWLLVSLLLWLLASGPAVAATSPAKVVQQFIDAHLQGHFAKARTFTLERVNLRTSLFSNWLFGPAGLPNHAGTADVFLSRKFAQVFRYRIVGATASGDNQARVTVMRSSPNLVHLYTWALAPKRGASPYELIGAIDSYLTKVNFPVEESRVQFTLVKEVGEWYISTVYDEKFAQLQQQFLTQPLSNAGGTPSVAAPPAAPASGMAAAQPATTTTSNLGRQIADAQFNATLQGFNQTYQQPPTGSPNPSTAAPEQEKTSFFGKIVQLLGLKGKGKSNIMVEVSDVKLRATLNTIRDAFSRYAVRNGVVPDSNQLYDWQSLHQLVERYSKKSFPATEAEAGCNFVNYKADTGVGDYTLLLELREPQNGVRHVEVTPYGVDRAG